LLKLTTCDYSENGSTLCDCLDFSSMHGQPGHGEGG
jgi:hypothetical protein